MTTDPDAKLRSIAIDAKLRSIVIAEDARPPDTREIGDHYDHRMYDVMDELWDGNLHYGLWRDENDKSSYAEAAEAMTDEMIRRLDPTPGGRFLDVGCGNGTPADEAGPCAPGTGRGNFGERAAGSSRQ